MSAAKQLVAIVLNALRERVVVIGNGGSGKSTFANSLAAMTKVPVLDLDLLHWENDGHGPKRDEDIPSAW
jgi:adenylate kinase family enzyme